MLVNDHFLLAVDGHLPAILVGGLNHGVELGDFAVLAVLLDVVAEAEVEHRLYRDLVVQLA